MSFEEQRNITKILQYMYAIDVFSFEKALLLAFVFSQK